MKKENDIRVEMFRVVDDLNPFIKVDYVDRDAEEHTGLMMWNNDGSSFGDVDEFDDCYDNDDYWEDNDWGAGCCDDYEDCDYARDTWDATTDGMYGDVPDGFDGDYSFMGR